jgi:ParB family chromosome partitioning protein
MSLIENIARRPSSNKSLYYEVRNLRARGYDLPTISRKLGIDRSYVGGIVRLVERDEPALIEAVESGRLPLTVATCTRW